MWKVIGPWGKWRVNEIFLFLRKTRLTWQTVMRKVVQTPPPLSYELVICWGAFTDEPALPFYLWWWCSLFSFFFFLVKGVILVLFLSLCLLTSQLLAALVFMLFLGGKKLTVVRAEMFFCWKKATKGSYVWDDVSAEWKVCPLLVIEAGRELVECTFTLCHEERSKSKSVPKKELRLVGLGHMPALVVRTAEGSVLPVWPESQGFRRDISSRQEVGQTKKSHICPTAMLIVGAHTQKKSVGSLTGWTKEEVLLARNERLFGWNINNSFSPLNRSPILVYYIQVRTIVFENSTRHTIDGVMILYSVPPHELLFWIFTAARRGRWFPLGFLHKVTGTKGRCFRAGKGQGKSLNPGLCDFLCSFLYTPAAWDRTGRCCC